MQDKIFSQFLDHYYHVQQKTPKPPADFQNQADRFTGTYRSLAYPRPTLAKLTALAKHLTVTANNDGTLSVVHTPAFVFGSKPTRLVNVDQLLFKRVDEDGYAAFGEDNSGQISYIFHPTGTEIAAGYEKLSWYQTFDFQLGLLAFFVVVFLSACIIWPLAYLIRRPQARRYRTTKQARLAALIAFLLCALNLAFLIGLALTVWLEPFQFLYGLPSVAIALLCLPIVTTGMTVGLLFFTGLAWRNNYWSALGRLYYTLITLAAVAFIPFLLYWNLLGFLY